MADRVRATRGRLLLFVWVLLCVGAVSALGAGTWPNCAFGCTAGDVALVSIRGVQPGAACEPGGTSQLQLYATFTANTARNAVFVVADVTVGGVTTHIVQCAGDLPKGTTQVLLTTVTWPCGSAITLSHIIVSWGNNNDTCSNPDCSGRGTAQCAFGTNITVTTPLVVDFSSNAPQCLGTPINFTSTTTGGTASYAYAWAFGDGGTSTQANPSYTYAAAGTYTVTLTVRDGAGAMDSHAHTVTVLQSPSTSETHVDVACFGGSTGSIDLGVTGGASPYSYSWSNGSTTQDLASLAAGTYTVTVTDAGGCTATRSVAITQPTDLTASLVSQTNIACFGSATGSVTVSGSGGTSPYTYSKDGATFQASGAFGGLAAGAYTITVKDANGCTTTARLVTITQPAAALSLSGTHANVACFGAATGSIDLTVTGGTAPYAYSWSNGAMAQDLAGLVAGTYTVTVADASGCTATRSVTIAQPAAAIDLSATHMAAACLGSSTGSIDLSVSGGTPPYAYSWSNGATSQDIANLDAGTYTVTVADANGCSATTSVTVTQPSAAVALSSTKVNVACFGAATGSIDLTATGGTPPYAYAWSNGATAQDLSGLRAGIYTVTVTDANGCATTMWVAIDQPTTSIALSATHSDASCFGSPTGSIDLSAAGGTPPYTYSWSNGATSQDIANLGAGTYAVTVTDASGCAATASATIVQPTVPLAISSSHTDIACHGSMTGSIDVTVSGGTMPYAYSWSTGATSEDLSGLPAKTYSVTVIDANGCSVTCTVTIGEPASGLSVSGSHTDVACFGTSTGSINLTVTGGTTPYTYLWSNGATSRDLNGLIAGTYSVTVTDGNGCTVTKSIAIAQPTAALSLSGSHVGVGCFGGTSGSIDLTVTGGTAPYSYAWSNGATARDLAGLAAGVYSVGVTDANGCTATWSVTLDQPAAALVVAATHTDAACFAGATGSIDLTVAGGTAPYSYAWSNGATAQDLTGLAAGTYAVLVRDANGCTAMRSVTISEPTAALALSDAHKNVSCYGEATGSIDLTVAGGTVPYSYAWSNGATSQDLGGLVAGTYTVAVTDAEGCTATRWVSIGQPESSLGLSTTHVDVACFGASTGSIHLTVTGGTSPYSYNWSNGATTPNLIGVAAGTYSVTVTDGHGCTAATSVVVVGPASSLSAFVFPVAPLLVGDTLALSGGPDGMTSYSWVGPNGFSSSAQNPTVSTNVTLAMDGAYALTVTNSSGCSAQASTDVVVTSPPSCEVALSTTHVDVACYGAATGAIDLTVSGGARPYAYSWSNGALTEDLSGLVAGTYVVTVTDGANCATQLAVSISQPLAPLQVSLTAHADAACFESATGSATVSATGGTPPYQYSRGGESGIQSSGAFAGLPAGSYTITVRDDQGCMASLPLTITQPSAALAVRVASQTNVACFGGSTGSVTVSGSGGTAPYTYSRDSAAHQASETFGGLPAGVYTITVNDANGCTAVTLATITQPSMAMALSETHADTVCFGSAMGGIDLTVAGGKAPYTYAWSNGATTEDLSALAADVYSVTVTDASGCTASASVTIAQSVTAIALSATHADVACFGGATGSIELTVTGGAAPYAYLWSDGATTEDRVGLVSGTYAVTVTDSAGCAAAQSVTVTQPTLPLTASITAPTGTLALGGTLTLVGGPAGMAAYLWTGPNGFASVEQSPTVSSNLTAAMAGTYTLTVIDGAECLAQASVNVVLTAGAGGECVRGIIISEVAWAGTEADPEAEWIELRNLLDSDIDFTGWQLRWRLANPTTPEDARWRVLPLSGTIGAAEPRDPLRLRSYSSDPDDLWLDLRDQRRGRDFFLLERVNDDTVAGVAADLIYDALPIERRGLGLSDEGEILELVDPTGCVVDTANIERKDVGGWAAGDEDTGATMERTDPAQGDFETNWHENLGIITYGTDAAGVALYGTAAVPNEPLLETGIEESETTTLVLAAEDIAAPLPTAGSTNNGNPTRLVTLAENSDVPAPATFHVTLDSDFVTLRLTNSPPVGHYEVWTRIGDTVLLVQVQVQ